MKISITKKGFINVIEDGFLRSYPPSDNISGLPVELQEIATEVWTPEVIQKWEEFDNGTSEEQVQKWRNSFKVDLYKLKIVLDQMGDLDPIETIIASQSKGVQLAWQNANTVRRDSPTVAGLAQEMSYTESQLDDIFKQADQIQL